jgi:biopolymer transport protein ExbB
MAPSAAPARTRLAVLLCGCLAAFFLFAAAPSARAQEPEKDKAPEAKKEEPKKAEEPASTPLDSGKQNLFMHIVKSAGWIFGPILLVVSVMLVALIVLLAMDLRMGNAVPPGFVEDFTDTVNKRQFKAAYEMAREDGSYLGRVMTTGMARLQYGIEDAREAAFNMVESIKASKEQLITYLATIGTLGPMLGLVGTVFGMILSFMELGRPGTTPRPDKLAEGISHALVVTLLGIALSVPAIFCHAFFRNRLIRISMDTANVADDLLTQMYHNSKKQPGAAGAAAPAPAGAAAAPAVPTAQSLIDADRAAVNAERGGRVRPQ